MNIGFENKKSVRRKDRALFIFTAFAAVIFS